MHEPAKSHIVVVEDDASTRALLVRQLQGAGYEAAAFGDGRAALETISAMNTGIVVADWSMPVMDGLELCAAVREMQAMDALGHVHFILLSAHRTKESVVEGLAAGADDYLTKPYHPGELVARIRVGERMLRLQDEAVHRTLDLQKANAQMALLANKLDQLASTDVLTRLPNRRRLFERFREAWQSAEADGLPLSCVMLDVDRFKSVNDTYGHAAGDEVLKEVASAIRRNAWRPEMCGRFGGEEFMLALPATPHDKAVALAEQVRADIAARQVAWEGATIVATISCGVAEKGADTSCPDELIRSADAMLYLAKEHGRNQTWVCGADRTGRPAHAADQVPVTTSPGHTSSPVCREPRQDPVQSVHANSDYQR